MVRLCFGSRKRFRAQFDLDANGYDSLDQWREDWQRARSSQFVVIGSKDETGGCQGCVATYLGEERFALRLRLPHALSQEGQNYQSIEITLAYGTDALLGALTLERAISYRCQWPFILTQFWPIKLTHLMR